MVVGSGLSNKITRSISISSGKGGVGKTTIVCNLAHYLAKQGNKVLILDGDLGMANVDILFKKKVNHSILDVLSDKVSIEDVLVKLEEGIYLIPGGTAIPELQKLDVYQRQNILNQINQLGNVFDYLLIDTAPGIDENVRYLNSAAGEIVIVVTPDPSSLTDSYALIKVLNQYQKETRFNIICNQVKSEEDGKRLFTRLSNVADEFLCVNLNYIGSIPRDSLLVQSTRNQELVLRQCPNSDSAKALIRVAENLSSSNNLATVKGGVQFFWEQLIQESL